jgi:P27 family predicted phage terminase small subunit
MDRHASRMGELSIEDGIGNPPAYLPKEAKVEWKRLASHPQYGKALTSLDRDGFCEYCWLHARLAAEMQGVCAYKLDGEIIKPEGGEGLLALTASDSQRLHSLRMQLGLTPASRSKVRIPEKPKANKWEVLKANIPSAQGA